MEETLMDGAHGERAFTCLKGGLGSHCYSCLGLSISCIFRYCAFFCCLARIVGEFLFRITSPSWESSWRIFLHSPYLLAQGQSFSFQLLRYFYSSITQCCWGVAVEDTIHHFLRSSVKGGSFYSSRRLVREIQEHITYHLHQAKHFSSPTMHSLL